MSSVFLLKLILTPTLIASATLIARRWGPVVAGWIIGLPLTSGPVSLFLALESGPEFAAKAMLSTLLGLLANMLCCLVYACMASRFTWPLSTLVALCVNVIGIVVASGFVLPLWGGVALDCAFIFFALAVIKKTDAKPVAVKAPQWDLPLRMVVATGIVLLVTALAQSLGPGWSGILSTLPVFTTIMLVFSHKAGCGEIARQFVRGIIIGSFSFIAFCVVVNLTLPILSIPVVYILASLTSVVVNGTVMALFVHPKRHG